MSELVIVGLGGKLVGFNLELDFDFGFDIYIFYGGCRDHDSINSKFEDNSREKKCEGNAGR
jgi:hypothetical protein